jgi:hypothetical protein
LRSGEESGSFDGLVRGVSKLLGTSFALEPAHQQIKAW